MTTNLIKEQIINNNSEMSKIDDKTTGKTDTSSDETVKTKRPIKTVKKKREVPDCNICQEKLTKDTYIRCPLCKQFFCKFCVEDWLIKMKRNRICPLCAKKWDDNFICNNLPLGFVVNRLGLRVYGLYSSDYEFETRNDPNHDNTEDEENDEPENNHESNPEENHESNPENNHESNPEGNHESNPEGNHESNPENNHEFNPEENREYNPENNHESNPENNHESNPENNHESNPEENRFENRDRRESILDFLINTFDLNADQETINLIRGLLLSDLFGH